MDILDLIGEVLESQDGHNSWKRYKTGLGYIMEKVNENHQRRSKSYPIYMIKRLQKDQEIKYR